MNVVDEYIAKLAEPQKTELSKIATLVKNTAPDSKQVITYGMPGFKYNNKYLISFGVFKDHMSIFPGAGAIEHYIDDLVNYKTSKGTIQFTPENPISKKLLMNIVKYRISEIDI